MWARKSCERVKIVILNNLMDCIISVYCYSEIILDVGVFLDNASIGNAFLLKALTHLDD